MSVIAFIIYGLAGVAVGVALIILVDSVLMALTGKSKLGR